MSSPKSSQNTLLHLSLSCGPIPKPNTVMEKWDCADELWATCPPTWPDIETRSPQAHWVGMGSVHLPKDGKIDIGKTPQHLLYFQDSTSKVHRWYIYKNSRDFRVHLQKFRTFYKNWLHVDYSMKAYPSLVPTWGFCSLTVLISGWSLKAFILKNLPKELATHRSLRNVALHCRLPGIVSYFCILSTKVQYVACWIVRDR